MSLKYKIFTYQMWLISYLFYSTLNGLPLDDKRIETDRDINKRAEKLAETLFSDANITEGYEKPTARIRVTVIKRSRRFWEPWELNHDVCPPSICTASDEQPRPRGTGGSVFYNGDIVLDKESEKIIYGNSIRLRYKRATMRSSRTWRDATVPYVFADDIAPKSKAVLKKAMKKIESLTCIKFRRKKLRDDAYVRYISEPGCWSSVGRVGGEQKLSIGLGCERIGTAIHEIAHVLGFWHEQARPDRDKYVKIIEDNISPRYLPDFSIADKTLVTSRGFPYDYESVMHYSKKAFTNVGDDTIKVIGIGKELKMQIGQRDELSTIDIGQLRDMYKCTDKKDDVETYCPSGWQKYIRWCYKFEDKLQEQFAGALKRCEDLNSRLLSIDDENEDSYLKRYVKKKYPDVKTWRTGGRVVNGTFVWYTEKDTHEMDYTHWKKGHPGGYSSLALVYNRKKDRVRWEGVWIGSYTQMPEHAYPFICERRARRKCVSGEFSDGRDYRGTLDHTVDGYTCQKWSSQYPWKHELLPYPYNEPSSKQDDDGLGDHNYCRNPSADRKSRPWCYTTKSKHRWQYCDVSICSKSRSIKNRDRTNNIPADEGTKTNSRQKRLNRKNRNNSTRKEETSKHNRRNNSNRRTNSNRLKNETAYLSDGHDKEPRMNGNKPSNRRQNEKKDRKQRRNKNDRKYDKTKENRTRRTSPNGGQKS